MITQPSLALRGLKKNHKMDTLAGVCSGGWAQGLMFSIGVPHPTQELSVFQQGTHEDTRLPLGTCLVEPVQC